MENKIELKHPEGKKAVSMDANRYNTIKKALRESLQLTPDLTQKQLQESVSAYIKSNNIEFKGSVGWHMEWVKLDMEARNEILRIASGPTVKKVFYRLSDREGE
jgi:hypothetical protein